MKERTLTITLQPDWKASLRQAGQRAGARSDQGEALASSASVMPARRTVRIAVSSHLWSCRAFAIHCFR